jgi:3-hydroxyisobutyrate dehydrogenase
MAERIGFVGVGRMGANMARRLKDQGFEIAAVYDVNTAGAQSLAQELGCQAATDLAEVTKASDIIITVVTDDTAMKSIFKGGLLKRAKGKLFINCATVSPAMHVWVEEKCESKGAQSLEACMASSITQAREGSLYLMCGGKEEVFNRAKPVLEKLSTSLRYVGTVGKASESTGQHGDEHQYRRSRGRTRTGRGARTRSGDGAGDFLANRCEFSGVGH